MSTDVSEPAADATSERPSRFESFLDRHPLRGGWLLLFLSLGAVYAVAGLLQTIRPESLVLTVAAVVALVVLSVVLVLAWVVPRLGAPTTGRRVGTVAIALVMAATVTWNAERLADLYDPPVSRISVLRCLDEFGLHTTVVMPPPLVDPPTVGTVGSEPPPVGAAPPEQPPLTVAVMERGEELPVGLDVFEGLDTVVLTNRGLSPVEAAVVDHCQDPDR